MATSLIASAEREFVENVKHLEEISTQIGDTWRINTFQDVIYLTKKTVSILPSYAATAGRYDQSEEPSQGHYDNQSQKEEDLEDLDVVEDDTDLGTLPHNVSDTAATSGPLCTFEYHVVFSPSYGVPVLYFNVYKQDGRLVPLEALWAAVPPQHQPRVAQDRWSVLTQQDHPLLRRPFYQLHPCKTADIIRLTEGWRGTEGSWNTEGSSGAGHSSSQDGRHNSLISWLSAVGPVVNLNMSIQYALYNRPSSLNH